MSLMKVIAMYDRDREAYIVELEAEVANLRLQLVESQKMMMRDVLLREKIMLDAIMAGAYDKKSEQAEQSEEAPRILD